MQRRAGFTLIEIVFAIFIFSVGALGLAAATAAVLRSLGESAARERAGRIAFSRLEMLRGLACASRQSGSESREGVRSTWTVSGSGPSLTAVEIVTYQLADGSRADSYTSALPCAR